MRGPTAPAPRRGAEAASETRACEARGRRGYLRVADQLLPFMVLPSTLPAYFMLSAVSVISSPLRRPVTFADPSVPVSIWKFCLRVNALLPSCHVPSTCAGTIQRSAVHQLTQSPLMVSV